MITVEMNSGLRVLLLHGFFGNAHNWRACVDALSGRWQVLAPQLPFFGLNHRADRISKSSIPVKFNKILKHPIDIMGEFGTVDMTSELCDLPAA